VCVLAEFEWPGGGSGWQYRFEPIGDFGGVGDVFEADDGMVGFGDLIFVDFHAFGDEQEPIWRAELGQESDQSLECGLSPEPEPFDMDFDLALAMDEARVWNPEALGSELLDVGIVSHFPIWCDLAQSIEERGELGGHIGSGFDAIGDERIASGELEAHGETFGSPKEFGFEAKIGAMEEVGEEVRDLDAVFGCGGVKAEWPIDGERVTRVWIACGAYEEPVEFEPTEELSITCGGIGADFDGHSHGFEEDGLDECDVVSVDEALGGDVVERLHSIFAAEIGEECGGDEMGFDVEFGGDGLEDDFGIESDGFSIDLAGASFSIGHFMSLGGGEFEGSCAEGFGLDRGDDIELGTIFEDFGDAAVGEGSGVVADEGFDVVFEL
jgi:hypothetical protein